MSNNLLVNLSKAKFDQFLISSEIIQLKQGDVLNTLGEVIQNILLPLDSVISLWAPRKESCIEITLIGNEGLLGITTLLNNERAPAEARVQYSGTAISIPVSEFLKNVALNPDLVIRFNRYLYVQHMQLLNTGACNCYHLLGERLARLLLMIGNRLHSNTFYVRQSQLSEMLGVRRASVTDAASHLQDLELIRYSRGNLTISNFKNLESTACECYRMDNSIYKSQMN